MHRPTVWGIACLIVLSWSAQGWGEEIRLKGGAKFSGTMFERNADAVIIGISRDAVESVDGRPLPPPIAPGTPAPAFTVVDVSGAAQSLEASRGHVTLIQFWATWCPHCRSDLSLMKELAARYQSAGLRILAVSIDRDPDALKKFLGEHPLPYPVISMLTAPELPERYEAQGVPTYILIDAAGMIVKTWSGSVTERASDFQDVLSHTLAAA